MDTLPTLTDEQLALLIQQGDKEKFAILMKRYEEKLLRYGRRFLSGTENIEDEVQEIFIKTFQNIQSFDATQRFSPWIYRIAHNNFVNALKKRQRAPLYLFDFDTLISHPIYDDPSMREREQREMRAMLDKVIDTLTPAYKEIIILYYLEEQSYKEIAEILRIPIGTVGIRLKRAKEALKKSYLSHGHEYGT